jgi:hypothetical protein
MPGEIDSLLLRQRAIASIPSKYETVLHEGGKERDAFWSRTHRFTYRDDEMPGPGTYQVKVPPGSGLEINRVNSSDLFCPRTICSIIFQERIYGYGIKRDRHFFLR